MVNKGTSEEGTERGKERREEASGGRREWEGSEQQSKGGKPGEGNFKGGTLRRTLL